VHYFALGNETWGCGGNMRPEYYADLYRHWATFLKTPAHNRPQFIASGGNDDDTTWTEVLSKSIRHNFDGIAHHYYTFPSGKWEGKARRPVSRGRVDLLLSQVGKIDAVLTQNRAVLDKNDPKKRLALYFDEWGSWYDPEPGSNPGFLVQRNTLRDALLAGLHFNVFHAHADRVKMSNIAQMVNVLQAMILTSKDKLVLTPTYHAFALYALPGRHLAAGHDREQPGLQGWRDRDAGPVGQRRARQGRQALPGPDQRQRHQSQRADAAGRANAPKAVKGRLLTAAAMDAQNELGKPAQVTPVAYEARPPTASSR
jgi:alpha-N-arabinofuranosidase